MPRFSRRLKAAAVILVPAIFMTGCIVAYDDPTLRSSEIVAQVRQLGGQDIAIATERDVKGWLLETRRDFGLVASLNEQCKPLRAQANITWADRTAEGRICTAAAELAPYVPFQFKADPRQFGEVPFLRQ